jgi:hypothetical protein
VLPPFPAGTQNFISTFVLGNSCFSGKSTLWEFSAIAQPIACSELPSTLQSGLVGYWPFCGNANDESGNGNDGVVNGAIATSDRFGNEQSAYFFDGTSFIDLTNTSVAIQSNLPRSISCWIWTPFYSGALISTGSPVLNGAFNSIVENSHFGLSAYGVDFLSETGITMQTGQWYQLSVTYDNGELKTYINGVLDNVGNLDVNTVGQDNYIGKSNDLSQTEMFWGIIDDVTIHNRALTQEEIQTLYGDFAPTTGCTNINACNFTPTALIDDGSCLLPGDACDDGNPSTENDQYNSACQCAGTTIGVPCSNLEATLLDSLIGYWPFCGNPNDASEIGNDGYVNGATLTTDRFGNSSSAYRFNGTSDFIEVNHNDIYNQMPLTMSVWVRSDGDIDAAKLITKYCCSSWNGWSMAVYDPNVPSLEFAYYLAPCNGIYQTYCSPEPFISNGTQELFNGNWHHMAFTVDSLGGTVYFDGMAIHQQPWYDNAGNPTGIPAAVSSNWNMFFGGHEESGTYFNGDLDDIGIWGRALSAEEVAQLFDGYSPVITYYFDGDGDGYGDPAISTETNTGAPTGYVTDNSDCNDTDPSVYLGATCDDGDAQTISDSYRADCTCSGYMCPTLDGTLQDGLVGYWPFCGNANDESGNGNDGVHYLFDGISFYPNPDISSSYGTDRFGNLQAALSTNVYAANVMIPVTNEIFQGDFSINVWAKNDSILSQYPRILGSENHHLNMQYGNTGGPVSFGAYMTEEGIPPFAGVGEVINPYEWVNITLVNEDYINRLYFNGILVDEASDFNVNQAQSLWNLIRIGNGTELPQTAFYGLVDDLVIYNRALTMAEINSLYTGEPVVQPACAQLDPALQSGLVGYWPFCGNANDESGNGNDGIVNGATLTEDRFGNAGSALDFDGINDLINIAPDASLDLVDDFSISAWFNADSIFDIPGQIKMILGRNGVGNGDGDYTLGLSNNQFTAPITQGVFSFAATPYLGVGGTDPTDILGVVNSMNWYHGTVTYNDTTDSLSYYLNGLLIDRLFLPMEISASEDSLFIGCEVDQPGFSYKSFFNGTLDDIGIWNRALTAEEIALLYGNFTPQVTGCTDPLASNYNPLATVNEGCEYTSTVFVYNDLNGNGMHEADEPGLGNWPVLVSNLNILLWTNANGYVYLPLPSGVQELEVLNPTENWVITTASTATVDFATGVSTASFGLQVIPGEAVITAGPYQGFWEILHCTDGYESGVYIENIGSQPVSGFLTLDCDPLFTPDADSYFTTPPTETGPGYALWNIEDFLPGEFELLSFHIDGPGVDYIGQFFNFEFNLNLFDPQGNMILSETWNVAPEVACAYDPNDITGFPEGLDGENNEGYQDPHFILEGHEVTFVVRFQNTGNYPAEDVRIDIPLDPEKWDIGSFTPFHASALDMGCLHDDGTYDLEFDSNYVVVKFVLEDIYLPDSVSNEEGSHGFVSFRINARQDLNPGTELYAKAYIYFDANPAVITNETTHTIFSCDSFSPPVGQNIYCEGETIAFNAEQPYVDNYTWTLDNATAGTGSSFTYPSVLMSPDIPAEYSLELTTSNALCPLVMYETEAEAHQVFIVVNPTPSLYQHLSDTLCAGEEVAYDAQSNGTVYWMNGAVNGSSTIASESFTAEVYALSNENCSSDTLQWAVTVNPLPSTEVDTNNNVLTAVDGIAWQWSVNGAEDVTTQSITALVSGNYQVEITNEFECTATSELFVITDVSFVHSWPTLTAYPNPMKDLARIELPEGTFDMALYDMTGRSVWQCSSQRGMVILERGTLASGVYQLRMSNADTHFTTPLILE